MTGKVQDFPREAFQLAVGLLRSRYRTMLLRPEYDDRPRDEKENGPKSFAVSSVPQDGTAILCSQDWRVSSGSPEK